MSFAYDYGIEWIAKNNLTTADLRLLMVMTGSTAATERSAHFIDDFSDLQESDAGTYVRKDLAGVTGTLSTVSHREEISVTAPVWTLLDDATNPIIGVVLYVHVTNDADSIPIAFYNDAPTFPFNGIGDDVTLTGAVGGIIRLQN